MPFRKKAPVSWLIVGLGNPGARFENTRHNVGFWAVDELARRADVAVRKIRFHALTADAVVGSQGVLLMKPTTFMNLSGQAVVTVGLPADAVPSLQLLLREDEAVEQEVQQESLLTAPVAAGETVGKVVYQLNGEVAAEYPLVAENAVEPLSWGWCLRRVAAAFLVH